MKCRVKLEAGLAGIRAQSEAELELSVGTILIKPVAETIKTCENLYFLAFFLFTPWIPGIMRKI
jgi:hypothetical protein